jgi:hypothetical protein
MNEGIEKFGLQSVQIATGLREKSTRRGEKLCRSSQYQSAHGRSPLFGQISLESILC